MYGFAEEYSIDSCRKPSGEPGDKIVHRHDLSAVRAFVRAGKALRHGCMAIKHNERFSCSGVHLVYTPKEGSYPVF
jgi:hypothetical protein